jgi:tetratricopeptide (TPR) repeat protein
MALREARSAVAAAPSDAESSAALALALATADRLTPALEEARRAVALDPGSASAQAALGIVLRLRKDPEASLAASRRAAESAPEDPRVLSVLADSLRESERYDEAMEMYGQSIDLDHEAIVPQLGAATNLIKARNGTAARGLLNLLLSKWDYAQGRVLLGAGALLVLMQDFESGLEMYNRIEVADNGALPALLVLYGKAYCLRQLGRPAEAEYFLSNLIGRVPREYDGPARGREILFQAYDDLVTYLGDRGLERRLESVLRDACDRPLAPTRLARRLAVLLDAKGKPAKAGAALEKSILASDPREDPIELAESALAMVRLRSSGGRRPLPAGSPGARALASASERIDSAEVGVAHYRLARAQALAGDRRAALESLHRARREGYLPIELMAQETDFESLRKEPAFEALLAR